MRKKIYLFTNIKTGAKHNHPTLKKFCKAYDLDYDRLRVNQQNAQNNGGERFPFEFGGFKIERLINKG